MDQDYQDSINATIRAIEEAPMPENFQEILDAAAIKFGDKIAINVFEDEQSISYADLQKTVYRLASGLNELGVKKGSRVGVLAPNRIEHPIAWLALAVLGAVMVPTNNASTARELDYLYNDASVEFLIADNSLMAAVRGMEDRPAALIDDNVIVLDHDDGTRYKDFAGLVANGSESFRPAWQVSSDDLINIQYTSGTTGLPKGCMQTQRYWIMLAHINAIFNEGIESILSDHPFFYMDPQWQLIWGLRAGATIFLARQMSTSRFLEWVHTYGIEYAFCSKPLLKMPPSPDDRNTTIKKFNAFGFSAANIKEAEDRFGVPVRQAFGMTEIGAGMFVPDEAPDDEILDTCGIPAPFRECKVVDEEGNEVPTNTPGELVIRGDGIFKGYYNKPETNETSFFGDWFRTGDLFIKDVHGYYKIIGRIKEMIRRSSENISASEVEQIVLEIPDVFEVAAVPVPDDYRGEEVKVYVRLKEGVSQSEVSPQAIFEHCSERLAKFKVPRFIEYIDLFPYTPSGKIAKQRLTEGHDDLRAGSFDRLESA